MFAARFALQDAFLHVFGSVALCWSGYLFAHYTATGTFVHGPGRGKKQPSDTAEAAAAVAGVFLVLAGLTLLPFALIHGNVVTASASTFTAFLGYILSHYGLTRDII